jgi:hypothetical protein
MIVTTAKITSGDDKEADQVGDVFHVLVQCEAHSRALCSGAQRTNALTASSFMVLG